MIRQFSLMLSLLIALSILITPMATAQGPTFDSVAAEEEGYWYSRYNLGNLVMRSGMGDTFMPDMDMVQQMVKMVDADSTDGDTAIPPTNAALLRSVYASGDPSYTQKMDAADFATQRWDPSTFDTTVTSQAMGWTMIKEVEWGKQFHVDNHFGTISDSYGAQQRFAGMVLVAEAKMQAQFALQSLKNEQGLIANSDGTVAWAGQWVMLEALSDLGSMLGMSVLPNSTSNRYADPDGSAMFLGAADMLFGALESRQPADVLELSLAIQALTWYAANTGNAANQTAAITLIAQHGDALTSADKGNATQKAYAIRGLIEAYRVSGDDKYLTAAANVFSDLAAEYDAANGIFSSQNSYTIDDVATVMGALNSVRHFGGSAVDQTKVEEMFAGFFENAVNLSGLQMAAPPKAVAKGAYEQNEPDIFYAYPGIPVPPMAGGEFGTAPVFATEVSWDGSQWSVVNAHFNAAGAMHASNEFIWFHKDEVNGFPEVTQLAAPTTLPVSGGGGSTPALNWALLTVIAGLLLLISGGLTLHHLTIKNRNR